MDFACPKIHRAPSSGGGPRRPRPLRGTFAPRSRSHQRSARRRDPGGAPAAPTGGRSRARSRPARSVSDEVAEVDGPVDCRHHLRRALQAEANPALHPIGTRVEVARVQRKGNAGADDAGRAAHPEHTSSAACGLRPDGAGRDVVRGGHEGEGQRGGSDRVVPSDTQRHLGVSPGNRSPPKSSAALLHATSGQGVTLDKCMRHIALGRQATWEWSSRRPSA